MTDDETVADSPSFGLSSSNKPPLKPTIKAEKITIDTPKTKVNLEETSTKNGQMVVIHKPSWKFDGNLINQLEKLKRSAAKGDNEASYILAMNLRHCYFSPSDDIELEKKLEQVSEFSDSERAVDRTLKSYEYCSGILQKQRDQFYKYSEDAANNGYVPAQEVISRITPELFMKSQGYEDLEREEIYSNA